MKKIIQYSIIAILTITTGCASHHPKTSNGAYSESRHVDHVRWNKSQSTNAKKISKTSIPDNSSRVFFYRKDDNADVQTSVNIGLNGRFQTSIQSGRYSQVLTCTGLNELGAVITNKKNNHLKGIESKGTSSFTGINMLPEQNYYFEVSLTDNRQAAIEKVDEQTALQNMSDMKRQNHQISRVVPICAQAPARIKLAVFFDTDKHNVKRKYYNEIERVATYLKKYTSTQVTIEGHTDNRASIKYNKTLSNDRAKAVAAVLVNKFGIAQKRVSAVGFGESRPIANNNTSTGRQKNRRVIASFSVNTN